MKQEVNDINTVYSFMTFNEGYILPARTAIASLKANKGNERVVIYILHFSISDNGIKLLESDSNDSVIIKCIKVDEKEIPNIKLHFHLTKEVILKVLAYRYIPKNVDKIFYFDGDVIILRSITEFYSIDIENNYFVCYEDQKINPKELDRLGLPHDFKYACAGAMLMNIKKMRNDSSYESRILIFFETTKINLSFLEQDMINLVFAPTGEIMILGYPYRFNRFVDTIRKWNIEKEKIGLIHYEGPHLKPWKGSATRHYMLWWKYARTTKEYKPLFWKTMPIYIRNLILKTFAKTRILFCKLIKK